MRHYKTVWEGCQEGARKLSRNILHCDMNNFYASVECMLDLALREHPAAVCGSVEERHGGYLQRSHEGQEERVLCRTGGENQNQVNESLPQAATGSNCRGVENSFPICYNTCN